MFCAGVVLHYLGVCHGVGSFISLARESVTVERYASDNLLIRESYLLDEKIDEVKYSNGE